MDQTTHPKNVQIRVSLCCNVQTTSYPAMFGEPETIICSGCGKISRGTWKPLYKEVTKGTYRKQYRTLNPV